MAYQKKSYKKFVATAATATLVATAIVPVASAASFADVAENNEFKPFIDALTEQGIIKGYTSDNTFRPNNKVTRGQVAIMLGRWLENNGETVPADWATNPRFSDVSTSNEELAQYAALVKDAGVFTGVNGELNPNQNISREHMAVVLDRVAETVAGVSLVTLAEEVTDEEITDLNKANADYRDEIQALVDLEISTVSNFRPKEELSRAQFAKFLYNTIEIIEEVTAAPALEVESVSAITSKSLKVTFNTAVEDTSKATFAVTRDRSKANVSTVEWNAEKTEATLTLTSKVIKGEYVVTTTGLTEDALTGSVTAEDEKVAKIEVLATEVPLIDDANADDTDVDDLAVPYKVTNQYGEDITKTTTIVTSLGTVNAAKGLIEINGDYNTTTNKTAAFSLINVESGVSTVATVNAVAASVVSEVSIVGVYNKDGKTLTETSPATDAFFLEIEVKDQYGNKVEAPTNASLLMNETNTLVADVANDGTTQNPDLDLTTVDGKILVPITASKAGTSTVTLIAAATGKIASYNLVVAESQRVNTITVGQPELVAVGEDALLPLTAYDKQGNEITDIKTLQDPVRGLGLTGSDTLVVKDGKFFIKSTDTATEGPKVNMVQIKSTLQYVTTNFTVRKAAEPQVVVGLSDKVKLGLAEGLTTKITVADIVVEDQYGRTISKEDLADLVDAGLEIHVDSVLPTSGTDKSPFTVELNGSGTDAANLVITDSKDEITLTSKTPLTNLDKTEKVTITLAPAGTVKPATAKDFTFTVSEITEFASYEVKAPEVIFNDTDVYDFEVYGVKSNGQKVLLSASQYSVVAPGFTVSGNDINLTTKLTDIAQASATLPTSKDLEVKVVLADGKATTVTKTVKVDTTPRKVAKFVASTTGDSTGKTLSALTFEATTSTNDASIFDLTPVVSSNAGDLDAAALEQVLYYVDQYGKETDLPIGDSDVTFTFTELVDADKTSVVASIVPTTNGSSSASVTDLEEGDTVVVTVNVKGVAAQTFKVTIK